MRHAKEMGLNEKQYIKAAVDFFNNGVGEMYYCEKTEKMYKYSNSERLMCVCSLMGGIHTFMKITKKEFYDTIIREKLIEV